MKALHFLTCWYIGCGLSSYFRVTTLRSSCFTTRGPASSGRLFVLPFAVLTQQIWNRAATSPVLTTHVMYDDQKQ